MRRFCLAFLSLLILPGCGADPEPKATADATSPQTAADQVSSDAGKDTEAPKPVLQAATGPTNFAVPTAGWYRGDLHFHTNYSEDAKKQNGDDLADALHIADAFRDPVYEKANPQYAGNGLDFVAVTDHRTDAPMKDPKFGHDHLIVLPGEEFGGSGHAGIWGLKKHITNDPVKGESGNKRHQDAVDEAHAQGALFSVNHPCQDNAWVWDVQGYDGIEVWNGPWSAFWGPSAEADIDARAKSIGAENPFVRQAVVQADGQGSNGQALRFWQYHLSAGRKVAPVGGGDRHMLFPAGLPATYVKRPDKPEFAGKVGKALGVEGILAGIQARATFVSRAPWAAQVEVTAKDKSGKTFVMGSDLPGQATYDLHLKVSRAKGGRLRLLQGTMGKTADGKWPEPTVVLDEPIDADVVEGQWTWQVPAGGGWIHPLVLEPLLPEPIPSDKTDLANVFSKLPTGKALGDMVVAFLAMMEDPGAIGEPEKCDPSTWKPWQAQCMPYDKTTWATFYLPDGVVRLMNTWFEDGKATEWCLGAIGAAFVVPAP